ncbi:TetR family transcriptional regulator [Pseudonocardia sediminis]|uniref:TetR family transcriptional regulator n=1 Tax=Pseudonocardia sediminis TaxID=1397368 RepID=A0A4Q7UXQ8_PSEST|nr:TetR/AcrR family transcriptional regulator [Pseudonocardia sediminis]RZT85838.1 TetR family transcriptional regulator [Pseudonocardia sediminis]
MTAPATASDRERAHPGRPPMSPLRRTRLRLEISRVAVRLFREHGVAGTSGERIAEEVGLSSRTLWRYFRAKEECVEPVLTRSVDSFVESLRHWPADRTLDEHLVGGARDDSEAAADSEAALVVIGLSRDEPALRAVWLVVSERAEAAVAELVAERLGRSPDELAIRVQAAAIAGALRLTSEEFAAALLDGTRHPDPGARLAEALHAATHGVAGDALDVR